MPHLTWIAPDGSTQEGFMVGFTTSALHQQGSAAMSPMSWSPHKLKRSVSPSLAGEVFMMSEGLAECELISGVLESAVYQDYEPIVTLTEIDIITRRAHGDRHEGGPAICGLTSVCHRCEKCFRSSWYEGRQEGHCRRTVQ